MGNLGRMSKPAVTKPGCVSVTWVACESTDLWAPLPEFLTQ